MIDATESNAPNIYRIRHDIQSIADKMQKSGGRSQLSLITFSDDDIKTRIPLGVFDTLDDNINGVRAALSEAALQATGTFEYTFDAIFAAIGVFKDEGTIAEDTVRRIIVITDESGDLVPQTPSRDQLVKAAKEVGADLKILQVTSD